MKECIATYILASRRHGTLYVGVTSNLVQRIYQHREHLLPGFTHTHDVTMLVYYEIHEEMAQAIHREKRLKKYKRQQKMALIESKNPHWHDLWESITA
ncbi:MAG: GIY-YIG nuclease [Azospirillum brasilense]|nr:MAG: GIY-YIG nuclease [Azospirillum brasilense]